MHLSCGCCSSGCVCWNHQDTPRGILVRVCDYHASLPFAPCDRTFRYDASVMEYVRVPYLPKEGGERANKCAVRGCHHEKLDGSDFCASCQVNRGIAMKMSCDNLTAFDGGVK